jgi:hypothetical protein
MLCTRKLAPTFASLVTLMALSSNAEAQRRDWDPDSHREAAGADIWLWALPHADFFSTAPIFFLDVEPADDFWIDVWFPWNMAVGDPFFDDAVAGIGNPSIQFRYGPKMGITRWWIGGGIGLPMSEIDTYSWDNANLLGAESMGFYNSFLWVDALPLWVTGGVDIRAVDFMSVQISGEPMLWFDVDDDDPDTVEFALQTRAGVEFRDPGSGVGGGIHVKFFWWPTEGPDAGLFQAALHPFFAYTGDVFLLRFGLLFALDEPLGPFFDEGPDLNVFSQNLVVGGQW